MSQNEWIQMARLTFGIFVELAVHFEDGSTIYHQTLLVLQPNMEESLVLNSSRQSPVNVINHRKSVTYWSQRFLHESPSPESLVDGGQQIGNVVSESF